MTHLHGFDPARLEEMDDFIARRTAEGGADISQ